jgi:hypothetical protein
MSLKKYITESERAHQLPVTGDVIQAIVNEEIALEFDVVGHSDDGFVIESDGYGLRVLEACNYVDDDTDIAINESPRDLKPGDSVMTKDRGMLKIKYIYTKEKDRYDALVLFDPENYKPKVRGGDFDYPIYHLGDPGSDLEYNKQDDSDLLDPEIVAKFRSATMAPGGAGKAVKQLYAKVYQSIEKNGYLVREYLDDNAPMFSQMFEKYEDLDSLVKALDDDTLEKLVDELESVADELKIQSRAYVGGWDRSDGPDEESKSNEGYRSITTEGTLMERIKDGKIYCPEACCGVKVMDCTCGAKCPHCNCKQIQKLSESIDNWKEQELLHTRMGNPDTAGYYTKKLNEAVATTQSLVEDVEDVEAMITRRIMNHPEFSDMVREYGIEQITQAITDTAEFHGDDQDEIGSSDISAMVNDTIKSLKRVIENELSEAEYQGREVKLGKPMQGDVKKFKVYVKDPKTGNTKKVNFGDPNMEIRRDNPAAKKSFRARHNCSDKKDRTKAGYWSCRMWSSKPVSKIV